MHSVTPIHSRRRRHGPPPSHRTYRHAGHYVRLRHESYRTQNVPLRAKEVSVVANSEAIKGTMGRLTPLRARFRHLRPQWLGVSAPWEGPRAGATPSVCASGDP